MLSSDPADSLRPRRLARVVARGRQLGFLAVDVSGPQAVRLMAAGGGESKKVTERRQQDSTAITSNAVHVSTELWLLEAGR